MNNKSEYLLKLEISGGDIVERYKEKIKVIDSIDPYSLQINDLETEARIFPGVTSIDILTYLVLTHSFYTAEQMKAYKSLSGYKFFESGFVQICGVKKISGMFVVLGKVKHSQRMTLPSLDVWVLCESDGGINTAHCTCMAGLSEVCSHVAACLYSLEFIHNCRTAQSCTDIEAKWLKPSPSNVPLVSLKNLKLRENHARVRTTVTHVPPIEGQELSEMLKSLREVGDDVALCRIVEQFSTDIANKRGPVQLLHAVYDIHKIEYEYLTYEELCHIAEGIDESMTQEQCDILNKRTIGQNKTNEWFHQRAGRITASKFKSVCHTNIEKPSISLIKSVCYPMKFNFRTKATDWGLEHERIALKGYLENKIDSHENFILKNCGLFVDPNFPAFGASPDSMVSCSCCGKGCVEVKCPYLLKNVDISDYLPMKNSCLTSDGSNVYLKRDHAYYYQVQLQLKLTHSKFCDFVVWSPRGFFEERIYFDEDFWNREFPKALQFFKKVILPELLGRYFTQGRHLNKRWCVCDMDEDGKPLLKCANDMCDIHWFHLECMGLGDVPESLWLCKACQS